MFKSRSIEYAHELPGHSIYVLSLVRFLKLYKLLLMVIYVCCQVSLLLGTIIRKIPLPSSSNLDPLVSGVAFSDAADSSVMAISDAMLDVKQLETIGSDFLEVLLKMKHNGAIDKTRAGFTALCNRLLCSNDPRYVSIWSFYSSCIMIFYFISCLRPSLERNHNVYITALVCHWQHQQAYFFLRQQKQQCRFQ